MYDVRHQAGRWSNRAGRQVRQRSRQMGRQFQSGLEESPLIFGLVAFAAGAALAWLLPQTRTENRMLGEYRDEFMDSAREMGRSGMQHAQNVVEEIRPEVEESAQRFVSEVKEAGQNVMSEVKEAGQHVVDDLSETAGKAKEKAKGEAEATVNEVSGKQQASSGSGAGMGMNKDIFQGQWNQLKGDVKQKWGKLTDDDMTRMEGDYDKFLGRIQERYGYGRERAEQEANSWMREHKSTRDRFSSQQSSAGQSSISGAGMAMNKDTFKGQWNQMKGEIKKQWGKLTNDDMTRIEGDYDKFLGRMQERYGYTRAQAEQEANKYFEKQKSSS
jgi:uncharacterized protein YjbJ (UPF0337 family)/gas vesicle protein